MITARALCEEKGERPEDVFLRQYFISRTKPEPFAGWQQVDLARKWWVTHCPRLQRRSIRDNTGQTIGCILGVAVERARRVLGSDPYDVPTSPDEADFWDQIEATIPFLAGSYVALFVTKAGQRMYVDPVMSLPAVSHAGDRIIASSPVLALSQPLEPNPRINHRKIMTEGGNYGLRQTCDRNVLRGLSNHYIDLETFELHRHWPREEDVFAHPDMPLDRLAAFMTRRLGKTTSALLRSYECLMPVSGGNDSRTVLFSARRSMGHAKLCFTHRTNKISGVDCYIADQLAAKVGHKLLMIDAIGASRSGRFSAEELDRWRWRAMMRTGFVKPAAETGLIAGQLTPPADLVLRGNILDMARANQWPRDFSFSIEHGISKLAMGGRPKQENLAYWRVEYQGWMDTLPRNTSARIYDFAFLELLLPQTLGGRLIGTEHAHYVHPFNDRHLIKVCLSVDPAMRKSGELNVALHKAAGAPDMPTTGDIKRRRRIRRKVLDMFVDS